MVPSVNGPSCSALGRRETLREEKEKGKGEEEGTHPTLYLFLSLEEYRKEESIKDKGNLWKYDQAWVRQRCI